MGEAYILWLIRGGRVDTLRVREGKSQWVGELKHNYSLVLGYGECRIARGECALSRYPQGAISARVCRVFQGRQRTHAVFSSLAARRQLPTVSGGG